jgi:hypothetical protein
MKMLGFIAVAATATAQLSRTRFERYDACGR